MAKRLVMRELIDSLKLVVGAPKKSGQQTMRLPPMFKPEVSIPDSGHVGLRNVDTPSTRAVTRRIPKTKTQDVADMWLKAMRPK